MLTTSALALAGRAALAWRATQTPSRLVSAIRDPSARQGGAAGLIGLNNPNGSYWKSVKSVLAETAGGAA